MEQLVDLILRERPEIKERTGFHRVCALREWIYSQTVVSVPARLLDRSGSTVWDEGCREVLALMRRGAGGFYCGGLARFASKVYAEMGIPAYHINIGFPDSETTHVVNIVPVEDGNGRLVYTVQDAYLDYSLIDRRGQPLDVRYVTRCIVNGQRETIIASGGGGGLRPVLVDRTNEAEGKDHHPFFLYAMRTARRTRELSEGLAVCWTPIMRPQLFEHAPYYADQYQEPLRARFGDSSIMNLLLMPLSTSGEETIEEVVASIRTMAAERATFLSARRKERGPHVP